MSEPYDPTRLNTLWRTKRAFGMRQVTPAQRTVFARACEIYRGSNRVTWREAQSQARAERQRADG